MMQNLKITLHIDGRAILASNPLDGLLAKLYFEALKEQGSFHGDFAMRLPFLELDKEGFYHVSAPIAEIKGIEMQEYTKSFDLQLYKKIFPDAKINRQMLNASSGSFKSYLFGYEVAFVDKVVFYARGDKKVIISLLQNLHFVGKKSAIGYGNIKKITVAETEENRSIIYKGRLMRNVPYSSRWLKEVRGETAKIVARLQHPYWKRDNRVVCAISTPRGENDDNNE